MYSAGKMGLASGLCLTGMTAVIAICFNNSKTYIIRISADSMLRI